MWLAMTPDLQILIIGGGLSGLSAALHLNRAGVEDLFVLEAEQIGQGGNVYLPGSPGPVFPDYTKMVLTPDDRGYTYLSRRYNREVARNLLRVKRRGVALQLALAREFDPHLVRQYGTLIVGEPHDERRLREEHRVMRDLGIEADIESYGAERIAALYGTAVGKYVQGLFVTEDAIIDSTRYVQAIARALGETRYQEHSRVVELREDSDAVVARLENGESLVRRTRSWRRTASSSTAIPTCRAGCARTGRFSSPSTTPATTRRTHTTSTPARTTGRARTTS